MIGRFFIVDESKEDSVYRVLHFASFEAAIQGTRVAQVFAKEQKDIWRLSDGRFVKMQKGIDPVRIARLVISEKLTVFALYKDWFGLEPWVDDFMDYNTLRWSIESHPGDILYRGKTMTGDDFHKNVRESIFGNDFDPYEKFEDWRDINVKISKKFYKRFPFEYV